MFPIFLGSAIRLAGRKTWTGNMRAMRTIHKTGVNVDSAYPLSGVRVLDLTRIVAGPYCSMILGDLGAEVIKVERPFVGDESRKWGPPFLAKSKDSTYFMACNRNKKSICVDLKKGSDIILELAKHSDVLIENFVPGKLAEYSLNYESVKNVAPHIIYCSITGYGSTGPYKDKPGYDVIAASVGGLLHITGPEDGSPAKVGVAMTDIATGLYAHGAILAALYQRDRTGAGQKIDVDLLSTQLACLINVASNFLNAGKAAQRRGTAHESIVPYQAFKTKTGYLTVGAGSDDQFQAFCDLLLLVDIKKDPRFANNQGRVKHRKELIDILDKKFLERSTDEWMSIFESAPFPVGPVNNIKQAFSDHHVQSIGIVKELPHATDGSIKLVGPPVVFSHAKNTVRSAPPILGQHTEEVLTNLLGYSEEHLKALRSKNIIQ